MPAPMLWHDSEQAVRELDMTARNLRIWLNKGRPVSGAMLETAFVLNSACKRVLDREKERIAIVMRQAEESL